MNMHVGLDVGSRTTAMGWRNGGRLAGQCNIDQTPAGRKAAVSKLLELKPMSVVMEATGIYSDRAGAAEGGDLFDLPVMGSQPVITNVSNTFCPSRAACRTSRNVSSSRTFGLAGFRAGVVFMLAGMRD
ncbi:MAG: hypothetical protein ABS999_13995 [Pseudomonas atacamensis]